MRNFVIIVMLMFLSVQINAQNLKPIKFKRDKRQSNELVGSANLELKNIESYFSFIPAGSVIMPDNSAVSCNAFYMLRFEVPNMLYRMFINDLKAEGKTELVAQCLPDTSAWNKFNEMKEFYFSHRSYNDYPVVQVPRKGVQLFCDWLNAKAKTLPLKKWKDKKITFRLPNEAEWMMAARGGNTNAYYAWDGQYLRDKKGVFLANFTPYKETTKDPAADNTFITAPVISYKSNKYGLYNMIGNVREMVQEEGFTKGGGYFDPSGECFVAFRNTSETINWPCTGFRVIAVVE